MKTEDFAALEGRRTNIAEAIERGWDVCTRRQQCTLAEQDVVVLLQSLPSCSSMNLMCELRETLRQIWKSRGRGTDLAFVRLLLEPLTIPSFVMKKVSLPGKHAQSSRDQMAARARDGRDGAHRLRARASALRRRRPLLPCRPRQRAAGRRACAPVTELSAGKRKEPGASPAHLGPRDQLVGGVCRKKNCELDDAMTRSIGSRAAPGEMPTTSRSGCALKADDFVGASRNEQASL